MTPARIRVLYFSDAHTLGGAEEYLYLLMEGLDRRRFDIRFACTDENALQPLIARLRSLPITVRTLSDRDAATTDRASWRNITMFWRFFRSQRVDIVHFNLPHPFACRIPILAARLAGVPVLVATNHLPTLSPQAYTWKGRLLLRLAGRCLDMTIVESEINRRLALDNLHLDPTKTHTIYHGIDVSRFDRAFDRMALRREFGLGSQAVIIGTVGRLTAQKAHDVFLRAAMLIKRRSPQARFLIVGDGELRERLERQARDWGLSGDVHFTGYRRDVPALLSLFDVFVLSSRFEGLPLSILEAMAAGKPVVATRVDGVPEAVVDGETGWLVPPGDAEVLADRILALIENPQRARMMGAAGRRRVESLFRKERMVAQTERLYVQLIEGFGRRVDRFSSRRAITER